MRKKLSGLFRRVQTRLLIVLVGSVLVITGFLYIDRYFIVRNTKSLKRDYVAMTTRNFETNLNQDRLAVQELLSRYLLNSDIISHLNNADVESYAKTQFDSLVGQNYLESLWLYRADGSIIYKYQAANLNSGFDGTQPLTLLKTGSAAISGTVRAYVDNSQGLKELFLVSFGKSNSAADQPSGYLVTARPINDNYLSGLASQTHSNVTVVPFNDEANHPKSSSELGKVIITSQISDPRGVAFKEFYVVNEAPNLETFAKGINQLTWLYVATLCVMFIGLVLIFRHIITQPLWQISDVLASQDLASALVAAKRKDEFGRIGGLIVEAFNLARQVEKEKMGIELTVTQRTKELVQARARLEASINSLSTGLLITFRDDTIALGNPALLKLFSLENNELRSITSEQLVGALQTRLDKVFDLKSHIQLAMEKNIPFAENEIYLNSRYLSIKGAPIHAENELKPIGTVVLVDDITESKQLEHSKDEFLSIASHELRTPLTVIRGNAALLQDIFDSENIPNEKGKYMLDDIRDSAIRLINIVNQFLTTSRLEQHKTALKIQPVDLKSTIDLTVSKIQPLANDKKLTIECHVPEHLPPVQADPVRLEEVLTNLVSNGIKYTDKGGLTITVKPELYNIKTIISDTGRGIEPKDQSMLFGKFQQATPNILTRDANSSTGLGLYITKLLIEQMGGMIQLDYSAPGKGSTFSFILPLLTDSRYANNQKDEKS